ncbi:MAG TPA: response regulator transcription factor [Solirubrobacteraceae bacterium]|jgi:two-component system response regulator NreC|nr:response regulator transcription factor [Solirubrobacteraceae bacterium]
MSSHLHLAPTPEERKAAPAAPTEVAPPIRVVLADDQAGMLKGLTQLLEDEPDLDVVGVAGDLMSVTGHVQQRQADVLVLDLSLQGGSSMEAIGQLRERVPDTEIVVLTMEQTPAVAQRALTAGACGYVTKDRADTELAQAIRAAVRGEQYVSPQVSAGLEELHRALTGGALTPREVEVLRLIALGHTSVEIARKLHLSPRTVETHRAHIHKKLALATRAQLVGYALRRGLLGT